ncbi:MAG TPA: glycosyltransferase, partial [Thermoanaerobaculia bacterium]
IVVDDGSTDGSRELILAVQAADPRVIYVRHDLNSGLPALRVNEGIELARGRFIAFQFDDDEWLEGALEALVERARADDAGDEAVVFGSALLERADGWSRELPDVPVHLLTLSFENRLANNSVLVPRGLFDRHGLYDCHVGMRRLCDWDLWLRLARHAPFLGIERRVSRATVATDAVSLGVTVPFELPLFRFLHAIPRDALLTPGRWRGYEVDGARIGDVEVPGDFRRRLETDAIVPWQRRLRHAFPHLAPPPPAAGTVPRSILNVLVTMDSFYGSFEMCAGQYDAPSAARGVSKMHYQPLLQIAAGWERDAGLLLLVRTVTDPGTRVLAEARAAGIPAGYYLDDDLLHLHEYGFPFEALGPGGERRADLEAQLAGADAVWLTNPVIDESVRPLNPRIVPHNGAVPESWLPRDLPPRGAGGRIRIGYAGDPYRIEEFRGIWSALRRISEEFGDRLEFDLWGIDAAGLPPLASPVSQRPYTFSYPQFIDRLRGARFDILLIPLLTAPRPRLAKAPSQYYHAAVAGALGIFSDVAVYSALPHGLTCLKATNDPEAWYVAIRDAVTMPAERFDLLRRRAVEHVRLEYTERAQIHLHEAAVRATEFHAATRESRGKEGRPRVRHAIPGTSAIAREYGVDAGEEQGEEGDPPALVFAGPGPAWVPREVFALGLRRVLSAVGTAEPYRSRIAMLGPLGEGDRQTAAIEALYILHRRGLAADLTVWGGSTRARRAIHELGLGAQARVLRASEGFAQILAGADLLLDTSGSAEVPAGVREAFAAGVLVLSNSPGARELVTDGVTGLLFSGDSPAELAAALEGALNLEPDHRARIVQAAYRLARGDFHSQRAASELFALYNQALGQKATDAVSLGIPVEPAAPSRRGRLREGADKLGIYRPLSRLYWSIGRRKRVLVTYDNDTTSVFLYWRYALPRLEAATGRSWLLRPASEVKTEDLHSFHAVISVRGISKRSLEILRAAAGAGARTVYDLDDNLLLVDQAFADPANPWRQIFGAARPEIEAMLRLADAVKVYAEPAVRSLLPFNPRVTAIRPFQILDRDALDPLNSVDEHRPLTVGFLGSAFKDDDLAPAVRAILRLLDEGSPLHFEFLGFLPGPLAGRPEVSHVPWRSDYAEYRRTLAALDWDIGLAPLRDLEFNRGKNNAKYREYAAAGIAGIYADAEIYRTTVVHRETGLVVPAESEQAWYEAILELAADAELRGSIRRNAFADVRANYREEEYVARVAALLEGPLPRRPAGSG